MRLACVVCARLGVSAWHRRGHEVSAVGLRPWRRGPPCFVRRSNTADPLGAGSHPCCAVRCPIPRLTLPRRNRCARVEQVAAHLSTSSAGRQPQARREALDHLAEALAGAADGLHRARAPHRTGDAGVRVEQVQALNAYHELELAGGGHATRSRDSRGADSGPGVHGQTKGRSAPMIVLYAGLSGVL